MSNLFHLVDQYRSLQQLDIEEVDEQTFKDTLEGLGGELQIKATNVALYQQNVQAFAIAIKEAAQRMGERYRKVQARADGLNQYLKSCMEAAQLTKIESPELTLTIKKNPPALIVDSLNDIPHRFMVTPAPEPSYPDKVAIKKALTDGQVIVGCRLDSGTRLEIK